MARRRSEGKAAKPKVYMCQTGTPGQLEPARAYTTLDAAKKHAGDAFAKWTDWCQRYNKAGVEVLGGAKMALDLIGEPEVQLGRQEVRCTFDEHTGMTLVVALWKERT